MFNQQADQDPWERHKHGRLQADVEGWYNYKINIKTKFKIVVNTETGKTL